MYFRKFIFLALLGVLGAVLAWMIFTSREQSRAQDQGPVEVSRTLSSTPTRVLDPQDLQVVEAAVRFAAGDPASGDPGLTAVHTVVIRNTGAVAYCHLRLSFVFHAADGDDVGRGTMSVEDSDVHPGQTVTLELKTTEIPPRAAGCEVRILHADIAAAAAPPRKG